MKTKGLLIVAMCLMVLSACTKKDDKAGQKEELPMVKVETVYDEDVAQVSEYTLPRNRPPSTSSASSWPTRNATWSA